MYVCLFVCACVCVCVCVCVCLPDCLCVLRQRVCLCLSDREISVCLFFCVCVCVFAWLSVRVETESVFVCEWVIEREDSSPCQVLWCLMTRKFRAWKFGFFRAGVKWYLIWFLLSNNLINEYWKLLFLKLFLFVFVTNSTFKNYQSNIFWCKLKKSLDFF